MAKARKQKQEQPRGLKARLSWASLGRWFVAAVLFAVMGSGAAWGVVKLQEPDVLPLKVVRIDGDFNYLKRQFLEEAVGRAVQGNFFTLDVEAVRSAASQLAWVDEVRVRRVWPDTLQMWVKEQVPLAIWGKAALVNERGEVFRPKTKELPVNLPHLLGPEESSQQLTKQFRRMKAQFQPLGLKIKRLTLDERRALTAEFQQGLRLQIGSVDVDDRLERFVRTYPRLKQDSPEREIKRVDLRYANGLAVYGEQLQVSEQRQQTKPIKGFTLRKDVPNARGQV